MISIKKCQKLYMIHQISAASSTHINNVWFSAIYHAQGSMLWLHLLMPVHAFSQHLAFNLLKAWCPSVHHSGCLSVMLANCVTSSNVTNSGNQPMTEGQCLSQL